MRTFPYRLSVSAPTARSLVRLVVTQGVNVGAELIVDHAVKMVGRARGADLVLDDRSVSRHHFHVAAAGEGVCFQVCDGAAPLVRAGREVRDARVAIGESFLVGNTILFVTAAEPRTNSDLLVRSESATTAAHSLLSGPAADVRALSAVFALNEALMETADLDSIEKVLATWANAHAACDTVEIAPAGEEHETMKSAGPVVERMAPHGGTRLLVVAPGSPSGWLAFTTKRDPGRITDSIRRLVLLAAALCGSRLAQLSAMLTMKQENEAFRQQAVGSARAFLGTSAAANELIRVIPRLATSDAIVLLTGETGVGKTFVARLLHESGPRKKEPLRVINCASIPENLIERELFGHERGAFTGAVTAQPGIFESAGRGTVLLDEIGELPLASQAKLLRVVEEKRFERLGSNRSLPLRARILAATNRDLAGMVSEGTFRSDLFFRLSVIKRVVPPLRERGEDVVTLAQQLLHDMAASSGRRVDGFSPEALDVIQRYPWPGNVRELRNVIEHAMVLGEKPMLDATDFPLEIRAVAKVALAPVQDAAMLVELPMNEELLQAKNRESALLRCAGNKTRAAALLGIDRTTFNKRRSGS
ncbi:sigma 54-interacting transcriptional regulator [Pendulispora albinea]|uniref:Sigma 54-interacting transcriptional regulator n=1 Tax=Pendulispora albinea TaxID=2741071 RepID=A0ABZ2LIY5_9BACT